MIPSHHHLYLDPYLDPYVLIEKEDPLLPYPRLEYLLCTPTTSPEETYEPVGYMGTAES